MRKGFLSTTTTRNQSVTSNENIILKRKGYDNNNVEMVFDRELKSYRPCYGMQNMIKNNIETARTIFDIESN